MLLTTTDSIPDADISEVLGIVVGSAVKQTKGPFKAVDSSQDTTKELKEKALEALKEEARELIADAVIDVRLDYTSDSNSIHCYATGTAVRLDTLPGWHLRQLQGEHAEFTGTIHEKEEEVKIEPISDEGEARIQEYMEMFGIDRERCQRLYDAGFTEIEELKEATPGDLLAIRGINPTIVRMIKSKLEP
jgi:uncharacterized protein YbjQ (UPF0145 family)